MCVSPTPFGTILPPQHQSQHASAAFGFTPINFPAQSYATNEHHQTVYYTVTPPAPPVPAYSTYYQVQSYGQPQHTSEPLLSPRQTPQFALKTIFEEMRHEEEVEALNTLAAPMSGSRQSQWSTSSPLSAGVASATVEPREVKPEPVTEEEECDQAEGALMKDEPTMGTSIDGTGLFAHFENEEILKVLNNNSFSMSRSASLSLPPEESSPLTAQWTCPPARVGEFEPSAKHLSLLGSELLSQSLTSERDQPNCT